MKKLLLSTILVTVFCGSVFSQVSSLYTFSQSAGTYTSLPGGTTLGSTTSDDEYFVDATQPLGSTTITTGVGFPIGFNFTYNNTVYDRFGVNNNGWISLGQSTLTPAINMNTSSAYTAISATSTAPGVNQDRIAGLSRDIQGQAGSSLTFQVTGSSPNQVLVIQYTGYRKFNAAGDNFSFQIMLYETSNTVKVVYGTMTSNATSSTPQVGLRGNSNADFNNRSTTTNWSATVAGGTNAATCTLSNTVFPASGTTFAWNLPVVFPIDMSAISLVTPTVNTCFGANETVTVKIKNLGTAIIDFSVNPVTVSSSVTGPNPLVFTPVVINSGTLAVNATQNVIVSTTYNMILQGNYVFNASTSVSGDGNAANDAMPPATIASNLPTVTASSDVTICSGTSTPLGAAATAFGSANYVQPNDVAIIDVSTVTSTLNITSTANANQVITAKLDSLLHTFDSDLDIRLIAPDASSIDLTSDNGVGGDNYIGTVFSTSGPSITTGVAPMTGTFQPEQPFSTFTGSANGTWTLQITDDLGGDVGTLLKWTLTLPNSISTYAWSPATGLSSTTIANPIANPTTTTTYTVIVTDGNGCTATDMVTVTVNPSPIVSLGPDQAQCSGTVILDALNPGETYLWSNSATTQQITVSSTGTYSVAVTNGIGCTSYDTVNIAINLPPTVDLGPDAAVCGSVLLDAQNSGSTYIWSTTETTQMITVNANGTYTVTVTDVNGCTNSDAITITINPLPVVALGPDQTQCGSAILDAQNPGATYLWSNAATTQAISVTSSGNYNVIVTDGSGCSNSDTVFVTINPSPVVNLGPDPTACGSVVLDAGNPGATYVWSTAATTQQITVTSSGIYGVTVTNSFGCTSSDAIIVTINPNPVVNFGADVIQCGGTVVLNAQNPGSTYLWSNAATTQTITVNATGTYSCLVTNSFGCTANDAIGITINPLPTVALGPNVTQCGGSVVLDAQNPGATYFWSTGASTQTISVSTSATYTVQVTDGNGCSNADTIQVTINAVPVQALGNDTTICGGPLLLNAQNTGSTFSWSTTATTQTISVATSGTYIVNITSVQGCTNADTINVVINPAPTVNAGGDTTICIGNSITLVAPPGFSSYMWQWDLVTANSQFITVAPAVTTQYTLTVTNSFGCTATDLIVVTVAPLPVASFTFVNVNGSTFNFTNTSTGSTPMTFNWNFGDGSPLDNTPNPSHTYTANGNYSVILTIQTPCGFDQVIVQITVTGVGIDEVFANGTINIFPNPTNGAITIEMLNILTDELNISIADVQGKVIYTSSDKNTSREFTKQIDLSGFANGVYSIRFNSGDALKVQRLIIAK